MFITRLKTNAQYESVSILSQSLSHRDSLVRLGTGYQGNPILSLRLVEIRHGNGWDRYLISAENRDLGIVKSTCPKRAKPQLDLSPSPS